MKFLVDELPNIKDDYDCFFKNNRECFAYNHFESYHHLCPFSNDFIGLNGNKHECYMLKEVGQTYFERND